jgi:hypothetical protein
VAFGLVGVVGHDDVRMVQPGGVFDLALKAGAGTLLLHQIGGQHLEGHDPIHAYVEGLVDLAHPAGPEALENAILTERLAGLKGAARHFGRGLVFTRVSNAGR